MGIRHFIKVLFTKDSVTYAAKYTLGLLKDTKRTRVRLDSTQQAYY